MYIKYITLIRYHNLYVRSYIIMFLNTVSMIETISMAPAYIYSESDHSLPISVDVTLRSFIELFEKTRSISREIVYMVVPVSISRLHFSASTSPPSRFDFPCCKFLIKWLAIPAANGLHGYPKGALPVYVHLSFHYSTQLLSGDSSSTFSFTFHNICDDI